MRQADLVQLAQIALGYPSRERFLTDLTLDPPDATSDEAGAPLLDEDYLILSTIHSAKGQEWKQVFILNVVDGCLPSDLATGTTAEIEEERRLLYVAMTRAKDHLHLIVPQRFFRSFATEQRGPAHVCLAHPLHPGRNPELLRVLRVAEPAAGTATAARATADRSISAHGCAGCGATQALCQRLLSAPPRRRWSILSYSRPAPAITTRSLMRESSVVPSIRVPLAALLALALSGALPAVRAGLSEPRGHHHRAVPGGRTDRSAGAPAGAEILRQARAELHRRERERRRHHDRHRPRRARDARRAHAAAAQSADFGQCRAASEACRSTPRRTSRRSPSSTTTRWCWSDASRSPPTRSASSSPG